jgi:hypothetical protein
MKSFMETEFKIISTRENLNDSSIAVTVRFVFDRASLETFAAKLGYWPTVDDCAGFVDWWIAKLHEPEIQ